jgi:6-pyruvoyltetrahydropterin/6-carboxytetrahydropterin synthase
VTAPALIAVRHNIEVAHRLWALPGKCQQIHGHSMWVRMELAGDLDADGLLGGLDFGVVKSGYRRYLDTFYDHRLLLDLADPLATVTTLPGLHTTDGQPTTENIARWVGEWASEKFGLPGRVTVAETHVNEAGWSW